MVIISSTRETGLHCDKSRSMRPSRKNWKANFRFLDKGRSHEAIRDEILSLARFDTCPYCNYSIVDELDHLFADCEYTRNFRCWRRI